MSVTTQFGCWIRPLLRKRLIGEMLVYEAQTIAGLLRALGHNQATKEVRSRDRTVGWRHLSIKKSPITLLLPLHIGLV